MTETALIVPLIITAVSLLLAYFIIRAGVFAGMRDYQKWIDKRRASVPPQRVPLTGPNSPVA